ncbi:hypothetical protein MKI79_10955 [Acinetobacter sp. A3.8]|uniref:Uncharacterized protein n=1 Tax=Acinetobacter sedimenti TaxID=2919922 RepID=A0A9X2B753_9GAMM|nr:hypothetical protein [Acinetobacter sedimenti]MCJ8147398.1 hypothetical protein [Acinetobacter sedimenti]
MAYIPQVLKEKQEEFYSLIFLIEAFTYKFDLKIKDLAEFLIRTDFQNHAIAYVNVDKINFIKLDKRSSVQAIVNILNILSNQNFSGGLLTDDPASDTSYLEYQHIHIMTSDIYNFKPLGDVSVNVRMGFQLLDFDRGVKFKDIDHDKLDIAINEFHSLQPRIFEDGFYRAHPRKQDIVQSLNNDINIPNAESDQQLKNQLIQAQQRIKELEALQHSEVSEILTTQEESKLSTREENNIIKVLAVLSEMESKVDTSKPYEAHGILSNKAQLLGIDPFPSDESLKKWFTKANEYKKS